ncbi:hypothetical protein PEPS_43520 (plasmid) [Persicobacter psychrovividus]|uniref:Uncharacterized protein n=1 Tax=Persicobacter psychrovividus TaxID=387638 RepID=A0ABM7VM38_9BACT|nr:hypothetical protein PEPS_43520 [Persicobacter psychrovividus]
MHTHILLKIGHYFNDYFDICYFNEKVLTLHRKTYFVLFK